MQILNFEEDNILLTNTVQYKIKNFYDGQLNIEIFNLNRKENITIVKRIKCNDDIFLLMQLMDILNRYEIIVDDFYIPYLMGARQDRVLDNERAIQPYTLKVVANLINGFNSKRVHLYDVHSEKSIELIKNTLNHGNLALSDFTNNDVLLCFPDKGAHDRYMRKILYNTQSLICEKTRNPNTNELSDFKIINLEKFENLYNKTPLTIKVIDDLCDGGGTFVGIYNEIRKVFKNCEVHLVVTHMIQDEAIRKLEILYDKIIITNSYSNREPKEFKNLDVHKLVTEKSHKYNVQSCNNR